MARYIKANRLVAEFLHLENDRNKLNDGNYLLWQQDMLEFGPLPQLNETLVMIGGLALLPHEAREEQDGVISRPLPIATDPRFILPDPTPEPEPEPEENNGESQGENSEQVEQPGVARRQESRKSSPPMVRAKPLRPPVRVRLQSRQAKARKPESNPPTLRQRAKVKQPISPAKRMSKLTNRRQYYE